MSDKLRKFIREQPDDVPSGWHTSEWWAEKEGLSRCEAAKALGNAVKAGAFESKKFRIVTGSRIYRVFHFREIEKPRSSKS